MERTGLTISGMPPPCFPALPMARTILWLLGPLTSSDGASWIQRSSGTLSGVAYGNDQFVAVGAYNANPASGAIVTSRDGLNWAWQPAGTRVRLNGILYANDEFVAVGSGYSDGIHIEGVILTSTDGVNWGRRRPGMTNLLYAVAYGGGKFVAVGGRQANTTQGWKGRILISTDGINWVEQDFGPDYWLLSIAHGAGQFVAADWAGAVWRSSDGVNWSQSLTNRGIAGVSFGGRHPTLSTRNCPP